MEYKNKDIRRAIGEDIITLDVRTYGIQGALPNKITMEAIEDRVMKTLVVTLYTKVAGETIDSIRYPSTWWDAFKEKWFPRLLRKSINYTEYKAVALYPNISLPDEKCTIVLEKEWNI